MMNNAPRSAQEIIAIACDEYAAALAGQPQNFIIPCGHGQHFAQLDDLVAESLQRERSVIRNIVIEQESHELGSAICRATSTSISPR